MMERGVPMNRALNKKLVRQRFDRHAHEYDRFAHIQRKMATVLLNWIEETWQQQASTGNVNGSGTSTTHVKSVLEIGCGTGILTLELKKRFPDAALVAIDLSPAMIAETRRKLGDRGVNATLITGDAETIIPRLAEERPHSFDLIVSNATFQWFNEPARTALACADCLGEGGCFAFSTFSERTFEELKQSFHAAERHLGHMPVPHGQDFAKAEDWHHAFAGSGLPFYWKEELYRQIYENTRSFLHTVKRIGAGNAVNRGAASGGIAGKALLEEMESYYGNHYSDGAGIRATYHLGYGMTIRQ